MAQQAICSQVTVPAVVTIPAGMSPAWFDQAVARSFEKDLHVKPLGDGRYAMQSSRDARVSYVVTAHSCGCEGNQRFGRCYHRARAAFEDWCGNKPGPSAPAASPVVRIRTRCAACQGSGRFEVVEVASGHRAIEECPRCNGSGFTIQPARIVAEAAPVAA